MKKFLCALMMAALALGITACGGAAEQSAPAPAAKTETAAPAADGGKKIIVAYFSHTGNTEKVAQLSRAKPAPIFSKSKPLPRILPFTAKQRNWQSRKKPTTPALH